MSEKYHDSRSNSLIAQSVQKRRSAALAEVGDPPRTKWQNIGPHRSPNEQGQREGCLHHTLGVESHS